MFQIDVDMHEIRVRFVRGVLANLQPNDLHSFVTGEEKLASRKAG